MNPHAVLLIGDGCTPMGQRKFANFNEYHSKDIDFFNSFYTHASMLDPVYNKFCFTRWFYIKNYAIRHNYDKVFAYDTDVMILSDVNTIIDKYKSYEFCQNKGSGHTAIFNIDVLKEFCDFLLFFARKGYKKHAALLAKSLEENPSMFGGVSDMDAVSDFYDVYSGSKKSDPLGLSHNITDEPGYVKKKELGIVEIFIKNGNIFLLSEDDGAFVRFDTLHFQGSSKQFVAPFYKFFYANKNTNVYTSFTQWLGV